MKNNFEYQINKLCNYVNTIGYHAHKNHPERLNDGKYIKGEPYDYEIFLPEYKACFDAKECKSKSWSFKDKDLKQAEQLKHCKNTGMDAFFLVYFYQYKKMIKFDVDIFIEALKTKKNLKPNEGTEWNISELINERIKNNAKEKAYH